MQDIIVFSISGFMSAPVRSVGFFFVLDGCIIAPETDPASGAVKEGFRNFR